MKRHLTSGERLVRSYCTVGSRAIDSSWITSIFGLDQAWKSINVFIVSFTSIFNQLKISFHTEIKNKNKKSSLKTVNHRRGEIKTSFKQSGISPNLRTGPTGHAKLFNQWEGALAFIKTSTQWSKYCWGVRIFWTDRKVRGFTDMACKIW